MKLDGDTDRLGGRFFYCACYESEANKRKKRLLASFIQSSPTRKRSEQAQQSDCSSLIQSSPTRKRSDKRNKAIARIFYTIEPDTKRPARFNLAGLFIPSFYPFLFKNNASIFKSFRDFRSCKCCIRTIYENANLYYLSL